MKLIIYSQASIVALLHFKTSLAEPMLRMIPDTAVLGEVQSRWRNEMETFLASLALWVGNPVDSLHK